MQTYKKSPDKRKRTFFILGSFFALFLIFSFFSMNNVYGFDSEIIGSSHIDTYLDTDLNQNNLSFDDNLDFHLETIQNTSNESDDSNSSNITVDMNGSTSISTGNGAYTSCESKNSISHSTLTDSSSFRVSTSSISYSISSNSHLNNQSDYFSNYRYLNDICKTNNIYYPKDNEDNLEKTEEKSTNSDKIVYNNFYSSFKFYNSDFNNYGDNCSDIDNYINYNIIVLISSSDFKGTAFENLNNFIKELSKLNLNKIDCNEDTQIIQDFQSSPKLTVTILFFIKIFMEHHDNGKEHLNSFKQLV